VITSLVLATAVGLLVGLTTHAVTPAGRLLAHARSGRRNVEEINVELHQALTAGPRVAGRYTLTAVMRRGQVIATEIYMFGESTADGRLQRVEQLSRDVSPKEPAH
jgi:hypothetical protein